jgi:hypothetical protein
MMRGSTRETGSLELCRDASQKGDIYAFPLNNIFKFILAVTVVVTVFPQTIGRII